MEKEMEKERKKVEEKYEDIFSFIFNRYLKACTKWSVICLYLKLIYVFYFIF